MLPTVPLLKLPAALALAGAYMISVINPMTLLDHYDDHVFRRGNDYNIMRYYPTDETTYQIEFKHDPKKDTEELDIERVRIQRGTFINPNKEEVIWKKGDNWGDLVEDMTKTDRRRLDEILENYGPY